MPPRDDNTTGAMATNAGTDTAPQPSGASGASTKTAARNLPKKRLPLSPLPLLDEKHLLSRHPDLKPHHVSLLYQHLHRQNYPPLEEFVQNLNSQKNSSIKNHQRLPQSFLHALLSSSSSSSFATLTSRIDSIHDSNDKTTTKLTVALQDGHRVETVIMRHTGRITICVSSQVGCAMACTFCATGTMGLSGNLCHGEILEQLVHASRILQRDAAAEGWDKIPSVRNVVFMGMGEPLQNYSHVVAACRAMIDRKRWNLSHGHVTVSTVGVTPNMRRLSVDVPQVNMALSLHAPNQKMREEIVPTAQRYPIEGLIEALDEHVKGGGKRRKGMIEYVMLEGPTSTLECAHQLGRLCRNRCHIVVNLIPYNQTNVKDVLRCPSDERIAQFQNIVTEYGVQCYVRRTMGADIAGACGQLVVEKDIEDLRTEKGGGCGSAGTNCEKGGGGTPVVKKMKKKTVVAHTRKDVECDVDKWVKPLAVATFVSGCCFVLSVGVWLLNSQKRRLR